MELLSNSLRDLQKRNQFLFNENNKLKSKMNLINEMNETLISIKNHLENTIKIISIQINSIDSMIPLNIDKELKKLRINYENLKQSLDRNQTQSEEELSFSNNNIIISNITGNAINDSINTTINTNEDIEHFNNETQVTQKVQSVPQSIVFDERDVRQESNLLINNSLPVIKTESECESNFICDQQNCGLKFVNAFRLSVHKRHHLMKHQMRHKFITNKKTNYTKHLTICQKNIQKTHFKTIQVNENVNNNHISNKNTADVRNSKYMPKNNKIKRNIYGKYVCFFENCGRIFLEKIRLIYHLRTHTDERPHKCHFDGCDKGFKTPGQLKNHINVHTGIKPYKCDGIACGQVCEFATLPQLYHHKKRYHSGIKPFKCDFEGYNCEESFISNRQMRAHKNIVHFNEKPKTVSQISVQQNVSQLNRIPKTRAVRNLDIETPIQIPATELRPVIELSPLHLMEQNDSQLNQIPNTISRNDNREKLHFNCDYFGCDKAFKSAIELVKHNREHIRIEPIVSLNENTNDIHLNTTTTVNIPNTSTPFTDNAINTTFDSSLSSSLHTTHNKSTCFTRESSLSSTNSSSSTTHSIPVTDKSSFSCSECDEQFDHKSQYIMHSQKHVKRFHCLFDRCGKSFRVKEQLIVHTRVHTGEKPFVCSYTDCGKAFKTTCQLSQHIVLHTGLKPYKCELFQCRKEFATHSQLIHHRKRYHSEITFQRFE